MKYYAIRNKETKLYLTMNRLTGQYEYTSKEINPYFLKDKSGADIYTEGDNSVEAIPIELHEIVDDPQEDARAYCKMMEELEEEPRKRTPLQVFEDLAKHPYRNATNDDGWECIKDDFPEDYEKVKAELKAAEILKEHLKVSDVVVYVNTEALGLESKNTGGEIHIHLTKEQSAIVLGLLTGYKGE